MFITRDDERRSLAGLRDAWATGVVELRHLRYFLALAQDLHFTAAARRLHIVQPALSQAIRQLEEDLEVVLVERSTHRVVLTEAGLAYAREAKAMLDQLERAQTVARQAAQGESGRLVLGFSSSELLGRPAQIIREFRQRYPAVQLDMRDGTLDDLIEQLSSGGLDLLCTGIAVSEPGLESIELARFPFACAVHDEHPLARQPIVRLRDLIGVPLILPGFAQDLSFSTSAAGGAGRRRSKRSIHLRFHDRFIERCRQDGVTLQPQFFVNTPGAGFALASCQLGAFLCHPDPGLSPPSGVVIRLFDDPTAELVHQTMLCWRRGETSAACRGFLALARSFEPG